MFCWQARAAFAEHIDKAAPISPVASGASGLERHLASCASCRAEVDALRGIRSLLADAAAIPAARMDESMFEQTILRKARARKAAAAPQALPWISASFTRPIPLGAALSLMILAVCLAHFLVGADTGSSQQAAQADSTRAASLQHDDPGSLDDAVAPPREVPFVVQQDLVGTRRGSIPLTTYVLEPAPREKPILRASL